MHFSWLCDIANIAIARVFLGEQSINFDLMVAVIITILLWLFIPGRMLTSII